MPVTEEQTLSIVCDNLACPGNDLPTDARTGWTFISGEVYGEPTLPQVVVCSSDCLATFSNAVAAAEDLKEGLEAWKALPKAEPKSGTKARKSSK